MAIGQMRKPAVAGSAAQKVPAQPPGRIQDTFSPQAQVGGANPAADYMAQTMGMGGVQPMGAPQGYAQPAQIDMRQMMAAQQGGQQRQQRVQPGQQVMGGKSPLRSPPTNAASPAAQDIRAMQDRRAGGNVDAYGAQLKNQMATAASGGMTPAMGAAQRMKNKGGAGVRRGAL